MRWVRRIILFLLAAVAGGVAWLWPRSHHAWDLVGVGMRGPRSFSIRSVQGKLEFRFRWGLPANDIQTSFAWIGYEPGLPAAPPASQHQFGSTLDLEDSAFELEYLKYRFDLARDAEFLGTLVCRQVTTDEVVLGVRFIAANNGEVGGRRSQFVALQVPHGYVVAAAMTMPLIWLVGRARRGARVRRGLCGRCGYDVRASTGTCPECGSSIAPRAAAVARE
jgi:hypothetical protein